MALSVVCGSVDDTVTVGPVPVTISTGEADVESSALLLSMDASSSSISSVESVEVELLDGSVAATVAAKLSDVALSVVVGSVDDSVTEGPVPVTISMGEADVDSSEPLLCSDSSSSSISSVPVSVTGVAVGVVFGTVLTAACVIVLGDDFDSVVASYVS